MVKHIILWTLKDEYTEAQKAEIRAGIKEGLEGLKGQIPGMIDISVRTDYLPTSTVDVMLDTTFEMLMHLQRMQRILSMLQWRIPR